MDKSFRNASLAFNWLDWIGQPLLYDGGLFVNRTLEENTHIDSIRYRILNVIKDENAT